MDHLDLPVDLLEPAPLGPADGVCVVPVDHAADLGEALRADVLGEAVEDRAAEPLAPVLLGDERHDAAVTEVGLARETRRNDFTVAVGDQVEPVRLGTPPALQLLDGRGPFARLHGQANGAPRFELLVGLGDAQVDHPDLFSFPCRFA